LLLLLYIVTHLAAAIYTYEKWLPLYHQTAAQHHPLYDTMDYIHVHQKMTSNQLNLSHETKQKKRVMKKLKKEKPTCSEEKV